MRNKVLCGLLAMGLGLLLFRFFGRDHEAHVAASESPTPAPIAAISATPAILPTPAGIAPVQVQSPGPDKNLTLEAESPKLDQIRKELEQNPHQTPPSIIQFAADLGEKMIAARGSETEAQKLYPELSNCARDIPPNSYASTPRTLCFTDAVELAKRFPNLSGNLESLKQDLDPDTLKRFNQLQKVMEKPNETHAQ